MPKTVRREEARQGRWGWQVLVILAVALLLAMGAWYAAEMFGQSTETPRASSDPATQNAPGGVSPATNQ